MRTLPGCRWRQTPVSRWVRDASTSRSLTPDRLDQQASRTDQGPHRWPTGQQKGHIVPALSALFVESEMIAPTRASLTRDAARMRAAFNGLTAIQRQALYLTAVEHRPVSYVAHRLELPTEVVDRIACAARAKVYQAVGSRA